MPQDTSIGVSAGGHWCPHDYHGFSPTKLARVGQGSSVELFS
jgi:hypothetical protein